MKKNLIKSVVKVALLGVVILVIFLISKAGSCCDPYANGITGNGDEAILEEMASDSTEDITETTYSVSEDKKSIYVYLCGAVNKPGVFELEEGARVYEAINLAGGLREDALATGINMAAFLEDAVEIYIPTADEKQAPVTMTGEPNEASYGGAYLALGTSDGLIDINRASSSELEKLNGIGPKLADSIVTYRAENGAFTTIEDIKKVSGIGNKLFAKIENDITVR